MPHVIILCTELIETYSYVYYLHCAGILSKARFMTCN